MPKAAQAGTAENVTLLCTDKTGTLTENKVILATATNHKSIDHNAALAVAGTIALPAPSCPGTPPGRRRTA